MTDEWGPWIEHDSKGCPVPVGTYFAAERQWRSGYTQTDEGVLTEEMYHSPCWWMKVADGSYTLVLRYRIRKPRGMTVLQEIVSSPERELEGVE